MSARERIVACVRASPRSTLAFIACQVELPIAQVHAELTAMVAAGMLRADVARATEHSPAAALYDLATETIGTCDICGQTDHHLIDDVCPTCRPKVVNLGARCPGFYACGEDDEL